MSSTNDRKNTNNDSYEPARAIDEILSEQEAAIGANRMANRHAIIREFTATEVLGSVSTILSDKTGRLTSSIITAKRIFEQ